MINAWWLLLIIPGTAFATLIGLSAIQFAKEMKYTVR